MHQPSYEELRRQLDEALARWVVDRDRLHRIESELRRLLRESHPDPPPPEALRALLWPLL